MVFRSPIIARPAWVPKLKLTMSILSQSTGLPFEFIGSYEQALAQYGQRMVDRINFERGRVRPSLSVNVSGGWSIRETEFPRVCKRMWKISRTVECCRFRRAVFRKCDCAAAQLSIAIADKFLTRQGCLVPRAVVLVDEIKPQNILLPDDAPRWLRWTAPVQARNPTSISRPHSPRA
jgi:hypothetical protein